MKNNSGQVLVLLIVIITVALATGLSIIQKSISDVSTATKVEQSSRAFSAAEAGIEKALQGGLTDVQFLDNNSSATVVDLNKQPVTVTADRQQDALEYPALAKEDVAQVWLADPDTRVSLPECSATGYTPVCYTQDGLNVYWGNSATDKAAIELTVVYYSGPPDNKYKIAQWFYDSDVLRVSSTSNGFTPVSCTSSSIGTNIYRCHRQINFSDTDKIPAGGKLMLMRVKLLYNTTSQPFAVQAISGGSLPPQARIIYSTGVSGETQRKVRIFQENKVVPFYFDYALFSTGDITK